jgi:hypothetical protein
MFKISSSSSSSSPVAAHESSCGMGQYHQLICLIFIKDHGSATPFDKYVERCDVITLTYLHKESKIPPPLLANMLNGVITTTYLHKGSKIRHPL